MVGPGGALCVFVHLFAPKNGGQRHEEEGDETTSGTAAQDNPSPLLPVNTRHPSRVTVVGIATGHADFSAKGRALLAAL